MEETNLAVLSDAKEEYTKQLCSILKPCIYQGIKSIYLDSKDICNQENTPDNVLITFQDLLSRIPKWSQDIINKEYQRILDVSKCDYIHDLLKVVYISHIKVLTIVHSAHKNKKITLNIPNGGHFIHLCYIECAREFWKYPYLFSDRATKYELQKNMKQSNDIIAQCIGETMRKLLPVRNILKEFLNEPDEDVTEADEEEDIKKPVSSKILKKLESEVKKELKSTMPVVHEDLIRKIIREEMEKKVSEGANPNEKETKKEVINEVVEKIKEDTLVGDQVDNEVKKNNVIVDEPPPTYSSLTSGSESSSNSNTNSKTKNEVKNIIESNVDVVTHEKVDKNEISTDSNEKNSKEEKEEEDNNIDDTGSNISDDEFSIDNKFSLSDLLGGSDDEEEDDQSDNDDIDEEDNESQGTTEKKDLIIDNIDEINLNLDELDDLGETTTTTTSDNLANKKENSEEESEALFEDDDLKEVDINDLKVKNSEKKEDTKFIFFKDAKNVF